MRALSINKVNQVMCLGRGGGVKEVLVPVVVVVKFELVQLVQACICSTNFHTCITSIMKTNYQNVLYITVILYIV